MSRKTIESVLKENTDRLMSLPGVVGIAQGLCEGKPCIKVLIIKKTSDIMNRIPVKIAGYRVMVKEVGKLRSLD